MGRLRTFTHATGFGGLETSTGSTAGHSVGDTVGVLVDDDIVLEGSITLGACQGPEEHYKA